MPKVGVTLVLHELRDPGNVGTIIRSADAAGATAVVLTGQSVDPFNPKTLRASAGSIFHLPVVVGVDRGHARHTSPTRNCSRRSCAAGRSHREVDFTVPSVVVIGNEADGLDAATIELCRRNDLDTDGRIERVPERRRRRVVDRLRSPVATQRRRRAPHTP